MCLALILFIATISIRIDLITVHMNSYTNEHSIVPIPVIVYA